MTDKNKTLKSNEFKCEVCNGIFEKGLTDKEIENIYKKVINDLDNWESCDEVKPPTEEDKLKLAIQKALASKEREIDDLKKKIELIEKEFEKEMMGRESAQEELRNLKEEQKKENDIQK